MKNETKAHVKEVMNNLVEKIKDEPRSFKVIQEFGRYYRIFKKQGIEESILSHYVNKALDKLTELKDYVKRIVCEEGAIYEVQI